MDQQLLDRILKCERLPSFPVIAARVIEMCGDENVSIRDLGGVLAHDPAISTKILRTINSSFYGLRHRITTVERATTMLGLNAVKMLALGFSLVPQLKGMGGQDFDMGFLWKRNLFAAVGAHTIAREVRFPHYEEAFIAGMLQDLGVIVLLQSLGSDYVKLLEQTVEAHSKLRLIEIDALDLDHAQVGAALAQQWLLPPVLITAIQYHESPDGVEPQYQPLVRSIALGTKAADCFLSPTGQQAARVRSYVRYAKQWFDLDQDQAGEFLESIQEGTRELGKMFEIDSSVGLTAADLLSHANEVLSDLSFKILQDATQLEQENQQLSDQASYDPLTSTLNRSGLDQMLTRVFEESVRTGRALSVIFVDADKFKTINDSYGHHVGDRVLQLIALGMTEFISQGGQVGRYGGDEFAMVLPGVADDEAAAIAQRICQRIEQFKIEIGEGPNLSVTVSAGVVTYSGTGGERCTADQLFMAADKAMYAAKAAGGNGIFQSGPIDRGMQQAG